MRTEAEKKASERLVAVKQAVVNLVAKSLKLDEAYKALYAKHEKALKVEDVVKEANRIQAAVGTKGTGNIDARFLGI